MENLNTKWLNICFIIDKSGSMYASTEDVIGGFNRIIEEQRANEDGKVTVSLYTFNDEVTEEYLGIDVKDIKEFKYKARGTTAMNDGIGMGIDNVGKWLYEKDKNGEEMPNKTLVIIMTDGMENASKEYSLKTIQDKIKEQTEKYSWEFIFEGVDITTSKSADELGIKLRTYSSRDKLENNYNIVNTAVNAYRSIWNKKGVTMDEANFVLSSTLAEEASKNTSKYEAEIGRQINKG
jgi:uncharacterized protein YegL